MNKLAVELIKKHEGFRKNVYRCPAGKRTIGYGYNLDANPAGLTYIQLTSLIKEGITDHFASELLEKMVAKIEHDLMGKITWMSKLNHTRQAVLIDMAYNIGIEGLMKFKTFFMMLERGDYKKAGEAMIASKWATQVKTRANYLQQLMIKGMVE